MPATIVYLLRHGDAGDKRSWKGNDEERPLSSLGVTRTKAVARYLARAGIRPTRILTSPYARALQTADIVAATLEMRELVIVEERLAPGFGADELRAILAESPADRLMLVGHEPSLSSVISKVIGGGSIVLRKGGFARLDIEELSTPRGRLVWLATPSLLVEWSDRGVEP